MFTIKLILFESTIKKYKFQSFDIISEETCFYQKLRQYEVYFSRVCPREQFLVVS